jgi:hypothetical protein
MDRELRSGGGFREKVLMTKYSVWLWTFTNLLLSVDFTVDLLIMIL